jgi:ubiquinone/menaquinone biosynthesis C-methylase UbiE
MAHRICPWWLGYVLASRFRRWLQDPGPIVGPYLSEGMTVLEPGPGMGFFTMEMARRVGPKGRVIAVDIQPKMLQVLLRRAKKAGLGDRVETRVAQDDRLGVDDLHGKVDFALVFAMVHEVPRPDLLFQDLAAAVKPGGRLLFAEPSGHVDPPAFEKSLGLARDVGFSVQSRPVISRSHGAVLIRS